MNAHNSNREGKGNRRKALGATLWMTVAAATQLAWAQPGYQVLDGVVAVVGNEIILESEVEAQAAVARQERGGAAAGAASLSEKCVVLEELLFQKLLVHQARLDSVEIADAEVMAEIDRRLAYYVQMLGSVEAFERQYGQSVSAWKADFQEPIREQLMAGRVQQGIDQQVRATPAEVQRLYESLPVDSLPLIPEQLSYSELVLQPAITEVERAAVKARLDSIRLQVSTGKLSFTLAAMRHSEDPGSKFKGGCYEGIGRGQFVPEFEAAAFDTPIGDLSPVFETEFGYHFLKPTERRGAVYSVCHVLMSAKVNPAELERLAGELERIEGQIRSQQTSFDAAVLAHSTREATRNQRGQVINPQDGSPRFHISAVDPNVFLVLSELAPGDVSAPVQLLDENENGYWVIFRLDARYPAHRANPKDDFALFQSQVEATLREEKLSKWMRNRIAETHVRIDAPYSGCSFDYGWDSAAAAPPK